MLDVLHFFFEEEFLNVHSGEQVEARDSARKMLYSVFYNKEYKYATQTSTTRGQQFSEIDAELDIGEIPEPIDPFARSRQTKSYIPPSRVGSDPMNPFGSALDSPLG